MKKMKYSSILIILLMLLVACSTKESSNQSRINSSNESFTEISSQTKSLVKNVSITEKETLKSNQEAPQINSENNSNDETITLPSTSSLTEEEKETEIPAVSKEFSSPVDEDLNLEGEQAEDFIIIGDSKYINIMHIKKFNDWITVAEKYGAKLYAIPYSDVYAKPNHIDILCDLMSDKGEYTDKIIESIKYVAQTGESVQLVGPQEFDDDFSIFKQDEWIVVSW